jgi:hypothetical protein
MHADSGLLFHEEFARENGISKHVVIRRRKKPFAGPHGLKPCPPSNQQTVEPLSGQRSGGIAIGSLDIHGLFALGQFPGDLNAYEQDD